MGLRHLARQRALQLLYGLEFTRLGFEEGESEFLGLNAKNRKPWGAFAHELARRTYARRKELDAEISPLLERWKIERIPLTDRICLRMGVCELEEFPDIPLRSTLDEYVELAKLFGTEDSPKYINGVLNRVAERFPHKDFHISKEGRTDDTVDAEIEVEESPDRPADAAASGSTVPPPAEGC